MHIRLRNPCPSPELGDINIESFPVVVGRGERCDIPIPVAFVSRRHCEFVREGREIMVHDLASANGTFVNGQPASYLTPVHNGDQVRLGPMIFRVDILGAFDSNPGPDWPGSGRSPNA